ncbi:MFS transporter [Streptomyces sp. H10-C2]|uniref:MFS transporter n=1 Tax=unclassified Streptomyces TaxID=2593676 RepID=UPI0024B92389|nr:MULTISPECIES: MFS transporter [unclassified Streptomyces]MDJ0340466.1 MFS transporter [Streptomyces sp. PH10-H1]MDJ0375228.1 MFS transporter [Streptomyces sp. H10-C2]
MSTSLRTAPVIAPAPPRRHLLALSAIVGTQLMLLLDATVVNVALPGIGSDLGFSSTSMSWILNVYILAFGGLLLLGSRIGDLIGRRRALIIGVLAFTAASVAGGPPTRPCCSSPAALRAPPPHWPLPALLPC